MSKKKQVYVDLRSMDRVSGSSTSDFTVLLPQVDGGLTNVAQVDLGSFEMPNTQLSIESQENTLFFTEGIVIGDSNMDKAYNQIVLKDGQQDITVTVPATLMPVLNVDFTTQATSTSALVDASTVTLTTAQPHGLQTFLKYNPTPYDTKPENRYSLSSVLVGAQPGPTLKSTFRSGMFLHQLPFLTCGTETERAYDFYNLSANDSAALIAGPGADKIAFDRRALGSMRVEIADLHGNACNNQGYCTHRPCTRMNLRSSYI